MLKPITLHRFIFHSLRKLLFGWVKTTVQNSSADKLNLQSDKPVCYVMRHRSLSDLMVLERECIKAELPRPFSPMNANNPDGSKAHFFLSQHEGLILQRERPQAPQLLDELLTRVEQNPEEDVQIIPVTILWGRSPDKEKSVFKLMFDWNFSLGGRFRKFLAIMLHGRETMVHFNPAMSLREIAQSSDDHSRNMRKINRILRVHFRQQKASVIGPDLSHRRTLVQSLIHNPRIQQAIATEAREISPEEAEARALSYANEIASDYSMPVLRSLDIVLTWFWNKLYSGVKINHVEPLKELSQTHTIVYVPCHRSHMDYLLLSYVLYYEGLPPPHVAAGINLNMLIVGTILRKSGAVFMRRTFRGNPLYSTVFHEYMYTLTSKGFATEYFVEGGRSRTGRTLSPKTGMLSITMRSFLRDNRRPMAFVPVYVGYEKVMEMASYVGELRGKSKKKESPLDIFRTLKALKDDFGKAWISFGNPIDVGNFLDEQAPQWRDDTGKGGKPHWLKKATNQLGSDIASGINAAAVLNPVNLVAVALLSTPRHALGEEELIHQLDCYTRLLSKMPYSNKAVMTDLDARSMIHYVETLKLVSRQTDSMGDIISMDEETAISMTYYRNNVLHMFAIPSMLSCLFVNNQSISHKVTMNIFGILYPYLKAELFLQWEPEDAMVIAQQWLDNMVEEDMIIRNEDANGHLLFCPPDPSSAEFIRLSVLSRTITQTLERFYMVISLLVRNGSGNIEQEALENQGRVLAQRLSIIHGLNAPEFFDKSLFRGFIEQLRSGGVLNITQTNKLEFGDDIFNVEKQAHLLLTTEIRHSIHQTTSNGIESE